MHCILREVPNYNLMLVDHECNNYFRGWLTYIAEFCDYSMLIVDTFLMFMLLYFEGYFFFCAIRMFYKFQCGVSVVNGEILISALFSQIN
ncbi:hypothetical protein APICC_10041 [Apis cerana cerana]|uniref:Uncharacterized protein n=1 Tax=Apis cerana cerana TaxID=94128 RepID=A0A2A3EKF7_APICC|nr:hypothetical protein APICC_10041 [Apis cerana cerana]